MSNMESAWIAAHIVIGQEQTHMEDGNTHTQGNTRIRHDTAQGWGRVSLANGIQLTSVVHNVAIIVYCVLYL